ncbi:hypothetical protein AGMMS49574_12160 [Bacteroidia bacterium]|nr:hypothetical protein AGMMS49574_12160 [Bacteroidia bacterium]GHV04188.1 hypothetical protein FACS189416_2010 [Bacteroidia bacterium]
MKKQLIVNFEKLEKFVARQKTALVGSVDSEGVPNIKAMLLAKKRELWQRGDKMFYPQGVTDPDYCILKFTAKEGRYYCNLKTESFPV